MNDAETILLYLGSDRDLSADDSLTPAYTKVVIAALLRAVIELQIFSNIRQKHPESAWADMADQALAEIRGLLDGTKVTHG